jgi:hypothetical protein
MRKPFIGSMCFALLVISGNVFGQTAPQAEPLLSNAFCKNDARHEVVAYCNDLFQFQLDVNAGTVANYPVDLNFLDLSNSATAVKFIPLVSSNLTSLAPVAFSGLPTGIVQTPDQQSGSAGSSSGSTSLLSTAGSAALLSLALDTGALTRSINGTTATLNANADEIFRVITRNMPDCILNCGDVGWFENKILNQTNISASFALAQQNSTTTATTGQASGTTPIQVTNVAIPTGAGRLSGITVRYQLMNKFDPRTSEFQQKWTMAVANSQSFKDAINNLGNATDPVMRILEQKATQLDRLAIVAVAQSDRTGEALANYFSEYFTRSSRAALQDSALAPAIAKAMQDRTIYRDAWYQVLDQVVGSLLTFDYSYSRPLNQPETHDVKLIYAYNFKTMGMLTLNGTASIYGGAIPVGAKYGRLHDGQLSIEYDQTLNDKTSKIQAQLSLAAYWQYQPNPSVLNIPAGTVAPGTTIPLPNGTQEFVGTAGSLWVSQAKITIKGSGGINIPIGVSWSNKTDLLQGSRVGAQVGISYNFSSLAGLFGGGGGK